MSFRFFLSVEINQCVSNNNGVELVRFLGSVGELVEGVLLGITSISSSDSASLLLMLLVLAAALLELPKKDRISIINLMLNA